MNALKARISNPGLPNHALRYDYCILHGPNRMSVAGNGTRAICLDVVSGNEFRIACRLNSFKPSGQDGRPLRYFIVTSHIIEEYSAQKWIADMEIGPYFNDFQRTETVNGEQVIKMYYGLFSKRFDNDLEQKQLGLSAKLEVVLAFLQTVQRKSEFYAIIFQNKPLKVKLKRNKTCYFRSGQKTTSESSISRRVSFKTL